MTPAALPGQRVPFADFRPPSLRGSPPLQSHFSSAKDIPGRSPPAGEAESESLGTRVEPLSWLAARSLS